MFGVQDAVEAYIIEQYDDDRDDEPISPFAADIGLKHYDHDFFETHHEAGLSNKESAAFVGHSYGESFAAEAWAAAEHQNLEEFDTVLLLYGYNHLRYPQATRPPQRVRFVGTFQYREPGSIEAKSP